MSIQPSLAWMMAVSLLLQVGCHAPMMKRDSIANHVGQPSFDQAKLSAQEAARVCIVTAEEYERAGRLPEAISLYEKGRLHDDAAIDYSRRLAVLYDQQGSATKALAEYRRALGDDPTNAELLNDFGYFQFQQGDLAAAEATLRASLDQLPDNQRAHTNLGLILAHQARYDEAFAAFSTAVGPAAAHSNIGAIMAKQGRTEVARQAFEQALAINPRLPQPRAFLDYLTRGELIARGNSQ